MRAHACLGALTAIGLLGLAKTEPPATADGNESGICQPIATTTVFIQVHETNPAPPLPEGTIQTIPAPAPAPVPPPVPVPGSSSAELDGSVSQVSISASVTIIISPYGSGGEPIYTGPKPWETRLTTTGHATHTVTIHDPGFPVPTGSNDIPGAPDASALPDPGHPGDVGSSGPDGQPQSGESQPSDGSDLGSPSGAEDSEIPKTDCESVFVTTLYRTKSAPGQGVPTVDTVIATLTVTFPDGSGSSATEGEGYSSFTATSPILSNEGMPHDSVITTTIHQPTLAPGKPDVPGANPSPPFTGTLGDLDSGDVVTVLTTTLHHSQSPSVGGDLVTLVPITWYETTFCPDPAGSLTPSIKTHVSTIASSLAQQPSASGTLGASGPGAPDAGLPSPSIPDVDVPEASADGPGGSSDAGVPDIDTPGSDGGESGIDFPSAGDPHNGGAVTVITATVHFPPHTTGSPGASEPSQETIVETITISFPGDTGSVATVPGYGSESGSGDADIVMTTTIVVAQPTGGLPKTSDLPGSPELPTSSPYGDLPSDEVVVKTTTLTVPNPSSSVPVSESGTGDIGPMITTSLYRTSLQTGPDGQLTTSTDTFVAVFSSPTPKSPVVEIPVSAPTSDRVTVITQTVYPTDDVPNEYGVHDSSNVPGLPESSGGANIPDGPGAAEPSVIVTSTIPAAPTDSLVIPSDDLSDVSPQPTGANDEIITVLTVTFSEENSSESGVTGTSSAPVIVQTLTFTYPTASDRPGSPPGCEVPVTASPGNTGNTSDGNGVPQEYGSIVDNDSGLTPSHEDPETDISGVVHSAYTGTVTHTVPDDYGKLPFPQTSEIVPTGSSLLTTDASVLPVPGEPTDVPLPSEPSVICQFSKSAEAGIPRQDQGQGQSTSLSLPSQPDATGNVSALPPPGLSTSSGLSGASASAGVPVPGQPPVSELPPVSDEGAGSASKTTCTSDLVEGSDAASATLAAPQPDSQQSQDASAFSPVVGSPTPSGNDALSLSPDSMDPAGYGFTKSVPFPSKAPGDIPTSPKDSPAGGTSNVLPTQPSTPSAFHPTTEASTIVPSTDAGDGAQQPPDVASTQASKDCTTSSRTIIVTAVETSTFVNVITQSTTTYTFPYEALVTIESTIVTGELIPTLKRRFKRQDENAGGFATEPIFTNTTSPAPTVTSEGVTEATLFPTTTPAPVNDTVSNTDMPTSSLEATPTNTETEGPASTPDDLPSEAVNHTDIIQSGSPTIPVQLPICTGATEVGNLVLDFDDLSVGPLLNPYHRFWFSNGFLVAPPPTVPYVPSSGGQLLEFVPPVLGNGTGTADTAQVGVGVDATYECFRFNFFGANLGCDARVSDQFCEFTFTGFRFNSTLNAEVQAMSQLAWVPSCPELSDCPLTPFLAEAFNDITSILITLRVDGEPSTWWADDLHVGWADNSCEAGSCRAGTASRVANRHQARDAALYWTPTGFRKLGSRIFRFPR